MEKTTVIILSILITTILCLIKGGVVLLAIDWIFNTSYLSVSNSAILGLAILTLQAGSKHD